MLLIFRADALVVTGQCTRECFTEYNRMAKVISEVYIPKSVHRRDFLGFLQQCWKYLPTYISKDDPFECSFSQDCKLPKYWTGGRNATGLLKYIAAFIASYLNAIDMAPHHIEEEMKPSFKIDMIVVLLSDQFTNKRFYASHKRKSSSKTVIVKVKPEIYGLNDAFINNHSSADIAGAYVYFCTFHYCSIFTSFYNFSQIILAVNLPRFELCMQDLKKVHSYSLLNVSNTIIFRAGNKKKKTRKLQVSTMYVLIIILIRTYPTSEKHPISNILRKFTSEFCKTPYFQVLRKFTCIILRTEVLFYLHIIS